MTCFLVVDAGNTRCSVGLVRSNRVERLRHLPTSKARLDAEAAAVVAAAAGRTRISAAAMCSVAPHVNSTWLRAISGTTGIRPLVISSRLRLGVRLSYPRPETIGADRLANACGAAARYGTPVIVADFGTALTIDAVSRNGEFMGGIIAPGIEMLADCLADGTALLPRIRLSGRVDPIGRSTESAMRIGARIGYRGLVRELTSHLLRLPGMRRAALCATGGCAGVALKDSGLPFTINRSLTLLGIADICALNSV